MKKIRVFGRFINHKYCLRVQDQLFNTPLDVQILENSYIIPDLYKIKSNINHDKNGVNSQLFYLIININLIFKL